MGSIPQFSITPRPQQSMHVTCLQAVSDIFMLLQTIVFWNVIESALSRCLVRHLLERVEIKLRL